MTRGGVESVQCSSQSDHRGSSGRTEIQYFPTVRFSSDAQEINSGVVRSSTTFEAGDHHRTVSIEATWTHLSLQQKSDGGLKAINGSRSNR